MTDRDMDYWIAEEAGKIQQIARDQGQDMSSASALEFARWSVAGKTAAEYAHKIGMASGSGYIYDRGDKVFRMRSDGVEEEIIPSNE